MTYLIKNDCTPRSRSGCIIALPGHMTS